MDDKLFEEQRQLERHSLQQGLQGYQTALAARGAANAPPGFRLVIRAVEPVAQRIRRYLEEESASGKRHVSAVVAVLRELNPEAAAYLTAQHAVNAMTRYQRLAAVAVELGAEIERETETLRFRDREASRFRGVVTSTKKLPDNKRRGFVAAARRRAGIADLAWSALARAKVGRALLEMLHQETGIVELFKTWENGKSFWMIAGSAEAVEQVEREHARCALMMPKRRPMVAQPRAWADGQAGGYYTEDRPMLKRLAPGSESLFGGKAAVYDVVNAIQATPWRVNQRVYDTLRTLWDSGEELPHVLPTREKAIGKSAVALVENAERLAARMVLQTQLEIAEQFQGRTLYFPHEMDWRGRIYQLPAHLGPQTDDPGKALMMFDKGKPLGKVGVYWLAVHLANLFGKNKLSFDERVQWVADHEGEIVASATGGTFWMAAKKPWQALAACFEWADYKTQGSSFASHLPIALDGSCNGLQHLSALMRDPLGGAAVNLLPGDKPRDFYSEVAEVVKADAKHWREIDRDLVKANVMTIPYNSTHDGRRKQLLEAVAEARRKGKRYLPDTVDEWQACDALAKVIYAAVKRAAPRAIAAMQWLTEAAAAVARAGHEPEWLSPTGILVEQHYPRYRTVNVDFAMGTQRLRMDLREEIAGTVDAKQHRQGFAPNFVHSLDAAHLVRTVSKLDAGVSYSMVHDSYGCHAADVPAIRKAIGDAFVDIHRQDGLAGLEQDLLQLLTEYGPGPDDARLIAQLPARPALGELDVEAIRHAPYLFG